MGLARRSHDHIIGIVMMMASDLRVAEWRAAQSDDRALQSWCWDAWFPSYEQKSIKLRVIPRPS